MAIYALSDGWVFARHIKMVNPQLPPLQFSPHNILLAICAMAIMQFWLSPKASVRNTWNRIRGRSTGFVGVR